MPFTCDLCKADFCLQHRTYAAHNCPKAAGADCRVIVCPLCKKGVRIVPDEDLAVTYERHRASKDCEKKVVRKCPAKGCRETLGLVNTFHCTRCDQDVCMKHRFEEDHPCQPTAKPAVAPTPKVVSAPVEAAPQARPVPKKKKGGFLSCLCGGKPKVVD